MIKPYQVNYDYSLDTALEIANDSKNASFFNWDVEEHVSTMMIHNIKYRRTDTYRIRQKLDDHYDHCQLGDCPECESLLRLVSKLNNCTACGISRNELVTLLMISGRLGLYLPDEMYRYISQFLYMGIKHICVCRKCKGTAILCDKCIICDPLPDKYQAACPTTFFDRICRS